MSPCRTGCLRVDLWLSEKQLSVVCGDYIRRLCFIIIIFMKELSVPLLHAHYISIFIYVYRVSNKRVFKVQ